MTRPSLFQLLRAARMVAVLTVALALPQASHAQVSPLGDIYCGQLGQLACTVVSSEWLVTGTGTGCDRGLKVEFNWSELRNYCVSDSRQRTAVGSWSANALRLQRELLADLPLIQLTTHGAHNAYNNYNDGYITYPNQQYSVTDQLRMGIRRLSLDVHWVIDALRLCHGLSDHLGCSPQDRPWFQVIEEVNQWLRRPENLQEVVFLELETYTDGHNPELAAPINTYLSDLVLRRSMLAEGPFTLNRLRALGKRVIVLGPADADAELFLQDRDFWPDSRYSPAKHFRASPCGYVSNDTFIPLYSPSPYPATTVRYNVGEDSVSYPWPINYNGPEQVGVITNETLRQLTACHVPSISLDQVTPDKLQHAVWSWGVNEPNGNWNNEEDCASMSGNGRWSDTGCGELRRFACRNSHDKADWRVTTTAGAWQQGGSQCALEHPGYEFDVPRTGYENEMLAEAAQGESVWLNLNDVAAEGVWSSTGTQASKVALSALGKCMKDSSGNASNGATLQLWDCNGGNDQQWILPGDGTIRSAINSNKCLDLFSSNTNNGGSIGLWDCHGGGNQRWSVSGKFLRSALNQNKVIDVSGGNTANGTRIQIWSFNNSGSQQWTQVPQ